MPTTGEPEDIMNEVPLLRSTTEVGPYYEIVPLNESDIPQDRRSRRRCPGCQRLDVEVVDSEKTTLRMTDDMWKGHNIFYLGSTLFILVSDKIRETLLRYRSSNLKVTETI
jgi:hypothetical protein